MEKSRLAIAIFIGGIALLFAIVIGISQALEIREFVRTPAVIRGMTNGNWRPIVRYQFGGVEHTESVDQDFVSFLYRKKGDQLFILVDPQYPYHAIIDSFAGRWSFPLIFGCIGLCALVKGWVQYRGVKKEKRGDNIRKK